MFVYGAEAVPFASGSDLKTAVDKCLLHDNTGVACCGPADDSGCGDPSTARCGVAGCDEMPDWDVSLVTDMAFDDGNGLFRNKWAFIADISRWDTSSVTDMEYMFSGASAFNADISRWNTSSVTNMGGMFAGASAFTADVSGWDTSSVTDMWDMF